MTISKPNLVRLLAAVFAAATSAWFSVLYTHFSKFRFEFEHQGANLIVITEEMAAYGAWLFALPVMALIVGLWLLLARPAAATTFEAILAVTWVLAFALALFCILGWQVQNVPTFSHMEWHY